MTIEKRALFRFFQYSLIGMGTFAFDLLLLFILTDFFLINYVLSAGVAFLIAVTCNYLISRKYVFRGTARNHTEGYVYFILIALIGLLFVTGSMYVLVDLLHVYYIVARIVVAAITGIWNYLINLFFNFKVAGTYE